MICRNFNADWRVETASADSRMKSFMNATEEQVVHLPYDAMIHEERDPNRSEERR